MNNFIRVKGFWWERNLKPKEGEPYGFYRFTTEVIYLNPNDIKAIFKPIDKFNIEGNDYTVFTVQTSFERMTVVSKQLEEMFG